MEEDEREGGRGEWVGLMGFSQGAKLAASLLLEQQVRVEAAEKAGLKEVPVGLTGIQDLNWRFGILLAGRAPLSNLNPSLLHSEALVGAGEISEGFQFCKEVDGDSMLRLPTLHVHGMADEGLHLHRILLKEYCAEGSARVVEWEGAHRIPLKSKDVERVVGGIYDVAEECGVQVSRTI